MVIGNPTGIGDLRFRQAQTLKIFEQKQGIQMFVAKFGPFARNQMLCVEVAHSRTERLQRIYRALLARISLLQEDYNRYESGEQKQLSNAESVPMGDVRNATAKVALTLLNRQCNQPQIQWIQLQCRLPQHTRSQHLHGLA